MKKFKYDVIRFDPKNINILFENLNGDDPLTCFHEYIVVNTRESDILNLLSSEKWDVSKVIVNTDWYKNIVFKKILRKYINKKLKNSSDYSKEYHLSMYDLDIGPATRDIVPVGEIWIIRD